jgi:hypothetical protein
MQEIKLLAVCESEFSSWLAAYLRNAAPQLTTYDLKVDPLVSFDGERLVESISEVVGMRLQDFRFSLVLEDTCEYPCHFHSHSLGTHNIYVVHHGYFRVSLSDDWNWFPFSPMFFGESAPTGL